MSMRCKLTGHDLNDCGVCKRCQDASEAKHDWAEQERERECFKRSVCTRCGEIQEKPDHDWTPTPAEHDLDGSGIEMKCSRCGLKI